MKIIFRQLYILIISAVFILIFINLIPFIVMLFMYKLLVIMTGFYKFSTQIKISNNENFKYISKGEKNEKPHITLASGNHTILSIQSSFGLREFSSCTMDTFLNKKQVITYKGYRTITDWFRNNKKIIEYNICFNNTNQYIDDSNEMRTYLRNIIEFNDICTDEYIVNHYIEASFIKKHFTEKEILRLLGHYFDSYLCFYIKQFF